MVLTMVQAVIVLNAFLLIDIIVTFLATPAAPKACDKEYEAASSTYRHMLHVGSVSFFKEISFEEAMTIMQAYDTCSHTVESTLWLTTMKDTHGTHMITESHRSAHGALQQLQNVVKGTEIEIPNLSPAFAAYIHYAATERSLEHELRAQEWSKVAQNLLVDYWKRQAPVLVAQRMVSVNSTVLEFTTIEEVLALEKVELEAMKQHTEYLNKSSTSAESARAFADLVLQVHSLYSDLKMKSAVTFANESVEKITEYQGAFDAMWSEERIDALVTRNKIGKPQRYGNHLANVFERLQTILNEWISSLSVFSRNCGVLATVDSDFVEFPLCKKLGVWGEEDLQTRVKQYADAAAVLSITGYDIAVRNVMNFFRLDWHKLTYGSEAKQGILVEPSMVIEVSKEVSEQLLTKPEMNSNATKTGNVNSEKPVVEQEMSSADKDDTAADHV